MKKYMLILSFISTISLAQDIYCPESLTCSGDTCTLNPDTGFFIHPVNYNKTDAIYYFHNAYSPDPDYPYNHDSPPACQYISNDNLSYTTYPKIRITAHAPLQNSEWQKYQEMSWACHNATNSKDSPQNCPFTVLEDHQKK